MMVSNNVICSVCDLKKLKAKLTFGLQPPSNRFVNGVRGGAGQDDSYTLSLGICSDCGTIQLIDRMPIEAVRPRYDWLTYNEPEGHLDDVADKLSRLPGISTASRFLGVTYKDQSSLDRLARKGFDHTNCIKEQQLGSFSTPFGLETIQALLSESPNISRIKEFYGMVDVLLVRHIIEHATSARLMLSKLKELLAPNGYMMLELPDSERILRDGNYPFIWEEHICYFTESSVLKLAVSTGAELVSIIRYPYAFEDSLVVLLRFPEAPPHVLNVTSIDKAGVLSSEQLINSFTTDFDQTRTEWQERIAKWIKKGEKVAVFGAGHLAVKFINFFELTDLIDCVVDDHPKKAGMNMPGSNLPIVPSTEIAVRDIRVCISTLSPESEVKVRAKLSSYLEQGGVFTSAFLAEA
jgi:hypothetical protein